LEARLESASFETLIGGGARAVVRQPKTIVF